MHLFSLCVRVWTIALGDPIPARSISEGYFKSGIVNPISAATKASRQP
jgi:hypothetical protein